MADQNFILNILEFNQNNFDQMILVKIIKTLFEDFQTLCPVIEPQCFCKMTILEQLPKKAKIDIWSLDWGRCEAKICYSAMYFQIGVSDQIKIEIKDKSGKLHKKEF